mmetsp:Transcript_1897/g.3051  ORF Transcript_1897/g.3051 Transcript_1897/m.3051 type:complete len:80 (-) Transcript_1897:624-863(-)
MSTDTYFYKFDNYLEFTTKESKANDKSEYILRELTLVGESVGGGLPTATRFRLLAMYLVATACLNSAIFVLSPRNRYTG